MKSYILVLFLILGLSSNVFSREVKTLGNTHYIIDYLESEITGTIDVIPYSEVESINSFGTITVSSYRLSSSCEEDANGFIICSDISSCATYSEVKEALKNANSLNEKWDLEHSYNKYGYKEADLLRRKADRLESVEKWNENIHKVWQKVNVKGICELNTKETITSSGTYTLPNSSGTLKDLVSNITLTEKDECLECVNGCTKSTKSDCNTSTCNYKCSKDSNGKEHWTTDGMCSQTLMYCPHEYEVEKPNFLK